MKLKLSGKMKIKELKEQFNRYFPYLTIEVFNTPHDRKQHSDLNKPLKNNQHLSDLNPTLLIAEYPFHAGTTVEEFEQDLQNHYKLPVQVYRRHSDIWIETGDTDDLTLDEQNNLGKHSVKN